MRAHRTFIYFFFLTALQDRHTALINAETLDRTGTEGGNITVKCTFKLSGKKRIFCKNDCEEKNILVQTEEDRAQNGRYSIEYTEGAFPFSSTLLYVNITNLTKSDSGRYRCVLDRWGPDGHKDFNISVEDAPTSSKPNGTLRPSSTSVPSASTLKTTQSLSSTSGRSKPSSASPETTEQQQTAAARPANTEVLLCVGVILVVIIVIFSVALLIFCRKRDKAPEETEDVNVRKADRVYEEIREDRQSRSAPVETSAVYTCAKYAKTNGGETTDDYSFVTAARPQNKTEDDSSKLTYSDVDFSDPPAASLSSTPGGDADNVIYSVPRTTTNSDSSHVENASAPLYSAVTLHQQ